MNYIVKNFGRLSGSFVAIMFLHLVLVLGSNCLHAAGIVETDTILASDLGISKYGPNSADKNKAHVITLLIKNEEKIVYHKSIGYYEFYHAERGGSIMLVNPEMFGSDFDGILVLMYGQIVARIPKFHPIPGCVSMDGENRATRSIPCDHTKFVIYYMVETLEKSELEKMDQDLLKGKTIQGSTRVACAIVPPRNVIISAHE